jgi:hypothetical protein
LFVSGNGCRTGVGLARCWQSTQIHAERTARSHTTVLPSRETVGITACQNDIDLESNELGGNLAGAFDEAIRCAMFDDNAAVLDPAEFTEPLRKRGDPWAVD